MQLKKPQVRHTLALATCALVNGTAAQAAEGDWTVSGSLLSYQEKDRVSVIAPAMSATRDFGDEQSLTVRAVYDALTGASPNGATVSKSQQTFTMPSGSTYTAAAYTLPMKKFTDSRVAVGVDWAKRTSSTTGRTLTANFSKETDYTSMGGSGNFTWDFNNKLTTLALAAGVAIDRVQPRSTPAAGVRLSADTRTTVSGEEEGMSKNVVDVLAGVTQVLSRRSLMQFNLGISRSSGYLDDPYKLVSIVDASGNPYIYPNTATGTTTNDYLYEKRPDTRLAKIAYWKFVHHFDEDVVHLNYRYFNDDWGIKAHTADLQYRFKVAGSFYVEPQLHYHQQSKANFFRFYLLDGEANTVQYASADLRLGEMTARSVGIKTGFNLGDAEISARLVKMEETGKGTDANAPSQLQGVNMYPKLDATIVNVSFSMPL